jgi:hypothetical protein
MDEIPEMSVVKRLRQAQPDPGDRPFVALHGQELACRPRGRDRRHRGVSGPVEHIEQVLPGALARCAIRQAVQHVLQGRPAHVREAEDP